MINNKSNKRRKTNETKQKPLEKKSNEEQSPRPLLRGNDHHGWTTENDQTPTIFALYPVEIVNPPPVFCRTKTQQRHQYPTI